MTRASSKGWTKTSPRSASIARARAYASSKFSPCRITSAPRRRADVTLASGAHSGMTMTAETPSLAAWKATPSPWLPALAATTPRRRSSEESCRSRLAAPRSLKEPVIWRFSSLTKTRAPVIAESVSEYGQGVSAMTPASRPRAARTSAASIMRARSERQLGLGGGRRHEPHRHQPGPGPPAPPPPPAPQDEPGRIAERHAQVPGARDGPLAHEEGVPALLEDPPGQGDRIAHAGDRGDGAVAQPIALHDRGIGLHGAGAGQHGAAPGIEARMILEAPDRRLDRVERAPARSEGAPARADRVAHPRAQLIAPARIGARPAVHDERGNAACHGSTPIAIMPGGLSGNRPRRTNRVANRSPGSRAGLPPAGFCRV